MSTTALQPVKLDGLVTDVETWNPLASNAVERFTYIDIASVHPELKEITSSREMACSEAPSRARQLVRSRDVLVSTVRPNLNAVAHVPASLDGATASTGFCVLRAVPSLLSDRYLFHWVRTSNFIGAMVRVATGASYPAVSDRIIRDSSIPLPFPADAKRSLTEQKRIAGILDKADSVRRQRQQMESDAISLLSSVFDDSFRPWLLAPTSDVRRLGDPDLSDIASGVTKGRHFNGQETVIVPYIRVANVQDGFLNLSEIKTIEALPSDVDALRLEHGDVLMTEGGDFDKLGRGAMWEADIPDCIHQNHVFRVRCNQRTLLPVFLANYIRTEVARGYFLRCAKKTSNLASMNKTQLMATPVPTPPLKLQERFATEVEAITRLRGRQDQATRDAEAMFQSLVHRAFRGEL